MVKKLLKQEFIYYAKTLIFIFPAILMLGISTRIIQFFENPSNTYMIIITSSYILLIFASLICAISTTVLAVIRFYKNMYSSEGYLTFTLPVTNHQHIISKLLAYIVCLLVNIFTILIAWLIALSGYKEVFQQIGYFLNEIIKNINIGHTILFIIEIIILFVVEAIVTPLLYYSCISIGQTAKKNRILLSIGVYYLYSVIIQIIGTFFTIILTILGGLGALDGIAVLLNNVIENHPIGFTHILLWIIIIISIGIGSIFYMINIHIMNKRLNIE